jgi:ATP-binding cassette subfamily B protein
LLASAAVLAVGVVGISRGTTTVPVIIVELTVANFLASPVRTLGLAHDYWHRSQISRQKVTDFLTSSARPADTDLLPRLRVRGGDVRFENVSASAASVAGARLEGFTAHAERGQVIALVGDPGSGASTLLDLVARLTDPVGGAVIVDDQDLAATAPWSAGTQVGFYRSDLLLMRGTIARNLSYAMPDASDAEVKRIIDGLGLDRLLDRLNDKGLTFWVTEGGRNLTPTDRNLIAFARALMGNPRILLLDEPLDGLHPVDRAAARGLILRHAGTVLWHTSDPADIRAADEVWFIEDGRLVRTCTGAEYGTARWESNNEGLTWLDV